MLEEKLDRIIALLTQIKDSLVVSVVNEEFTSREVTGQVQSLKLNRSQLRDKRIVEQINHFSRKNYLQAIRKYADRIIEVQRHNSDFYPQFNSQSLDVFKRVKHPEHSFYVYLLNEIRTFADQVNAEGKKLIDDLKQ